MSDVLDRLAKASAELNASAEAPVRSRVAEIQADANAKAGGAFIPRTVTVYAKNAAQTVIAVKEEYAKRNRIKQEKEGVEAEGRITAAEPSPVATPEPAPVEETDEFSGEYGANSFYTRGNLKKPPKKGKRELREEEGQKALLELTKKLNAEQKENFDED